jgi:hypothetical protein
VTLPYIAYGELDGRPNIVVDGAPTAGTVLTLSHWPGAATPAALRRDLSAEIALAYLESPDEWVDAAAVSNNHLDTDGVVSVFALVDPETALAHRARLVEIARAGDFSWTNDRTAARIAFAVEARIGAGDAYEILLERMGGWLADPDAARPLWQAEDDALQSTLDLIDRGDVVITNEPELGLSVVEAPPGTSLHPGAVYATAGSFTVLTLQPGATRIDCRYEGWVQFVSRPVPARRDLRPLAARLTERDDAAWSAGAPADIMPSCEPEGPSVLAPELVRELTEAHLASAPPAWDPSA